MRLLDVQPYQINVRFDGPGAPANDDGADDAPADAAAAAAEATAKTELVLFPALSPLNKRKQISFVRSAPFSFDLVYADEAAGASHIATVLVEGFEADKVVEYTSRALKAPKVRALTSCPRPASRRLPWFSHPPTRCCSWMAGLACLGLGRRPAGWQRRAVRAKGRDHL